MKWLKSALSGGLLAVVFIVSCRRDDPQWDLDLTVPIAYGNLSLDNLMADSLTSTSADGSLRISHHSKIPGISADTLFNIPDTTISNAYHIPGGQLNMSPGDNIGNQNSETQYALAPVQLVYGVLERGKAIVRLQNDIQRRVIVVYELSSATLNGNPVMVTDTLPAAPSATVSSVVIKEIDLSGYEIDFTGINGNRVNTVATIFSAVIDPTETSNVIVFPADSVVADVTFSGIRPYYVRGYFGSELTELGPEETYSGFFSKVESGQLGLDSLSMTLTLENYAGLDMRFTVNNLWTRRQSTNQSVYLSHPIVGQPININRAQYSWSYPPSIPQVYSWRFDNSNSNIVNMMELMPDYFGYDFSILTNPLGNVSGNNDFLYSDFGINAYIDVDMPVNFFADQIVLVDTVDTDFGTLNSGAVREANITIHADNSFPLDAILQVFMIDENNNLLDQVVASPGTVYSGPLSVSGGYYFSNGSTQSVVNIPLNESQTANFLNSTRLVVKATFDTHTNPSYVKIFTTNRLAFDITADFEYRVNN